MILDFGNNAPIASTRSSIIDGYLSPNDTKDKPPPYSGSTSRGHSPRPPLHRLPPESPSSSTYPAAPPPTVNQLHLDTGSNAISGTFYIDPKIPNFGFNAKGFKAYKKNPPHASFRTRQGAISLELATTGEATDAVPKANILVASNSGDIDINLLPTAPSRPRIGLEVSSRKGNIVVFLPHNFAGALQLSTRKGSIEFLPGVARAMKVLKENNKEAFVMLGEKANSKELDFCQLNSRTGRLIVGFADVDRHEPKPGFWKKLGQMFGGE